MIERITFTHILRRCEWADERPTDRPSEWVCSRVCVCVCGGIGYCIVASTYAFTMDKWTLSSNDTPTISKTFLEKKRKKKLLCRRDTTDDNDRPTDSPTRIYICKGPFRLYFGRTDRMMFLVWVEWTSTYHGICSNVVAAPSTLYITYIHNLKFNRVDVCVSSEREKANEWTTCSLYMYI